MSEPIPAYQRCTDCQTNKRACAMGMPGFGCLCVQCFQKRMDDAKQKRKPRRQTVPDKTKRQPLWSEMLGWTQEQKCARGYCLGCEFCDGGRASRPMDKIDEL
jgi:hypothetical protein